MPEKIESELKRVENLEEDIKNTLDDVEDQSSHIMALVYGIILGIAANIAASIIYEILLKDLSPTAKTVTGVFLLIIVPVVIFLIIHEFRKIKKSKEKLCMHLGAVSEHKKRINKS